MRVLRGEADRTWREPMELWRGVHRSLGIEPFRDPTLPAEARRWDHLESLADALSACAPALVRPRGPALVRPHRHLGAPAPAARCGRRTDRVRGHQPRPRAGHAPPGRPASLLAADHSRRARCRRRSAARRSGGARFVRPPDRRCRLARPHRRQPAVRPRTRPLARRERGRQRAPARFVRAVRRRDAARAGDRRRRRAGHPPRVDRGRDRPFRRVPRARSSSPALRDGCSRTTCPRGACASVTRCSPRPRRVSGTPTSSMRGWRRPGTPWTASTPEPRPPATGCEPRPPPPKSAEAVETTCEVAAELVAAGPAGPRRRDSSPTLGPSPTPRGAARAAGEGRAGPGRRPELARRPRTRAVDATRRPPSWPAACVGPRAPGPGRDRRQPVRLGVRARPAPDASAGGRPRRAPARGVAPPGDPARAASPSSVAPMSTRPTGCGRGPTRRSRWPGRRAIRSSSPRPCSTRSMAPTSPAEIDAGLVAADEVVRLAEQAGRPDLAVNGHQRRAGSPPQPRRPRRRQPRPRRAPKCSPPCCRHPAGATPPWSSGRRCWR